MGGGIAPTICACTHGYAIGYIVEEIRLGNIYGDDKGTGYVGNVWDKNGICPCIMTMQGGGREPMIVEAYPYDEQNQTLRKDIVGTITTDGSSPKHNNRVITVAEMRGRDTTNPSHRGPANENYEQRLEVREDGCTNTITTVQKDNLVIEQRKVQYMGDWVWEAEGKLYEVRLRKLTPRECWRLMDFSDEDFEKAERVNSNTQLYKQAGNSIVRQVLVDVFKNLYEEEYGSKTNR